MNAFNYRAHNLELDMCVDHGYWLDAGEDKRVLDLIEARARDLRRISRAEAGWQNVRGGGGGGFLGSLRRFFGR